MPSTWSATRSRSRAAKTAGASKPCIPPVFIMCFRDGGVAAAGIAHPPASPWQHIGAHHVQMHIHMPRLAHHMLVHLDSSTVPRCKDAEQEAASGGVAPGGEKLACSVNSSRQIFPRQLSVITYSVLPQQYAGPEAESRGGTRRGRGAIPVFDSFNAHLLDATIIQY